MYQSTRALLSAGYFVPVVYFGNLFLAGFLTPSFDHIVLLPSELGRDGMPVASYFNVGLLIVSALALTASLGLLIGMRAAGHHVLLAIGAALSLAAAAVGLGMAAIYPLPHPLHYGFGLSVAAIFLPAFGVFVSGSAARWFFVMCFAVPFVYVTAAYSGFANESNFGLWIRIVAVANFSALAVLCAIVRARLPTH